MFTKLFWKDTAERAVKTIAQALLALWLAGEQVFNILAVNWEQALGVALGAGVILILSSIVSSNINSRDSASVLEEKK